MGFHFFNSKEAIDLVNLLKKEKRKGAISGGVFGSILRPNGRTTPKKDIDVLIIDPNTSVYGEVEHETGEKSGVHLHIFRKRPGKPASNDRRGEILADAEAEAKKLF
ncbi:MAG: hypothetical protein WC069_04940 [Candidatus Shapirobacteria bacterium]